jgi:predicted DNA-binding protein
MDARLDPATRQKVDDLAQHFHRPRAAVLCHIMHWGLSREPTGPLDQGESHGPVGHLYLYVPSELRGQVEKAAAAAGVNIAPWLRYMVRQTTMADFPASRQEARSEKRSHDSRTYGKRYMMRLDNPMSEKLEELSTHYDKPAAEIIHQLIAQAELEDFPAGWQMKAIERPPPHAAEAP